MCVCEWLGEGERSAEAREQRWWRLLGGRAQGERETVDMAADETWRRGEWRVRMHA